MVSPTEHPLTIAAAGWSPSTAGVVRGPVVYFDAKKKEEFEKFRGRAQGCDRDLPGAGEPVSAEAGRFQKRSGARRCRCRRR